MINSSKKLPCGHIFHTVCLRSWFQRQQTCPTCRLNILRTPITASQPVVQQVPANANQNNANRPAEQQPAQQPMIPPNPFLNLLNQAALNNMNNQQPQTSTGAAFIPSVGTSAQPQTNFPMHPPLLLPPFMTPFNIPPPPMPQNLDQLSDEELRALEGNERSHIQERLKLLKNISTMINASISLMNQYQMVVANLPQPSQQVSSTSTSSEQPTKSDDKPDSSSGEEKKIDINQIKVEDLGSESHLDEPLTKTSPLDPSSSSISPSTSTSFIANEMATTSETDDSANEIRKRRLQKFLQSN